MTNILTTLTDCKTALSKLGYENDSREVKLLSKHWRNVVEVRTESNGIITVSFQDGNSGYAFRREWEREVSYSKINWLYDSKYGKHNYAVCVISL